MISSTLITHFSRDFEEEAQDFSRLLFAFGDAAVHDLAQHVHVDRSQQILTNLLHLLHAQELQICSQAVEFWQTYTEVSVPGPVDLF